MGSLLLPRGLSVAWLAAALLLLVLNRHTLFSLCHRDDGHSGRETGDVPVNGNSKNSRPAPEHRKSRSIAQPLDAGQDKEAPEGVPQASEAPHRLRKVAQTSSDEASSVQAAIQAATAAGAAGSASSGFALHHLANRRRRRSSFRPAPLRLQLPQEQRLRTPRGSGLLGSRMRRRLGWKGHSRGVRSSGLWVGPGSSRWPGAPVLIELAVEGETEEELSDKCVLAFRGDAISRRADPIGRTGPRNLRLLACQIVFPRDGGRQRNSLLPSTLRGVSIAATPASAFREHRLASGALVVLVSCPACPRSAVSFYIRRYEGDDPVGAFPPTSASSTALSVPSAGCGVDFVIGELGGIYRALGIGKPWVRQAVVCSGEAVHFAAASKPQNFPMLVKALASQLSKPVINEAEAEKAFIAAASSFNGHLLYGHPRAVAMHLALKCGVGAMARIHYGTWRSLDRWADRQGLSVPEAIKRYHEQTYMPGRITVAVVDGRSLSALEAAIGPSLAFLAYPDGEAQETGRTWKAPTGPGEPSIPPSPLEGKQTPSPTCETPALHYLECNSDQQETLAFFSFFLPPDTNKETSAGWPDLAVSLRARRLVMAMLAASGRETLLSRLVASQRALRASVHLPISNDSGAMIQIEVALPHAKLKDRLADAGEMIFAFIAALMESPPDDWFVMEQQRLSAFDQVYALPKDVLQAAIDAATDAAHGSELGVVESNLAAAAAMAVSLLQHLSPSKLHLVLQSPSLDSLASRVQPHTLARYGEGELDPAAYKRWSAAFWSRKEILSALLSRWGLSLPKRNAFAGWMQKDQSLSLSWEPEEQEGGSSSGSTLPTRNNTPLPSPSPRSLTEAPIKSLETFGIPRCPPEAPAHRRKSLAGGGLSNVTIPPPLRPVSNNERSLNGKERDRQRTCCYKQIEFPPSHPCYKKCDVKYRRCGDPPDPRASVSLRLNCWVGEKLVAREEAAAEVFLSLVRAQTQAVIEEASQAGIAAASSAGSFAAETHDSSVRRGDTIVLSVSGPREGLEGVLLALLLPLSPAAAAVAGAPASASAAAAPPPADLSHAAVTAANNKLVAMLQELPSPEMLLTETALDMLVSPQKSRENLEREIRRAPIDRRLAVAWRDSLWKSLAIHATIEGNITEQAAVDLMSLVISTLRPTSLASVTEALPSRVMDLRGLFLLFRPSVPSLSVATLGDSERQKQRMPLTALYIHPAFAKTAFHAVRVYVQLGPFVADTAKETAAAAAGEWFAAAVSIRLQQDGRVRSAAKPPYYLSIGGVGYLSCTITSSVSVKSLILSVNAAIQSISSLSVEEALREVELSSEWMPQRRDFLLCPFFPLCPEHVNRSEQPLLEQGIEQCLRALRGTPRLLLVVRGSLVSGNGTLGAGSLGFAGAEEIGEIKGIIAIRETEGFKEILTSHGYYFDAHPNF